MIVISKTSQEQSPASSKERNLGQIALAVVGNRSVTNLLEAQLLKRYIRDIQPLRTAYFMLTINMVYIAAIRSNDLMSLLYQFISITGNQGAGCAGRYTGRCITLAQTGFTHLAFCHLWELLIPLILWNRIWAGYHAITTTYTQIRIINNCTGLFILLNRLGEASRSTGWLQAMEALLLDKTQIVICCMEFLNNSPAIVIQFQMSILNIARLSLKIQTIIHFAGYTTALASDRFCYIY